MVCSYNILALKEILRWGKPNGGVKFCNRLCFIWDCGSECILVVGYLSAGSGSRINVNIFWGQKLKAQVILPWSECCNPECYIYIFWGQKLKAQVILPWSECCNPECYFTTQTGFFVSTYLPPATKLGQGYIFTGVCDSVHGEEACVVVGGGVSGCQGACVVAGGTCGCRGARMVAGGGRTWDTVNERAVRILLECILVWKYV